MLINPMLQNYDDEQSEINNVKTTKTMDITEFKTEFEKILDSKLSDKAEFTQEAVASVASHVIDKFREIVTEWQAEREAIETDKIQAQKDAEEARRREKSEKGIRSGIEIE